MNATAAKQHCYGCTSHIKQLCAQVYVDKQLAFSEQKACLVAGEGSCGEGVALAAANLALLSAPCQDLVNVLISKGLFFLLCFIFFANLQNQPSRLKSSPNSTQADTINWSNYTCICHDDQP